MALGLCNPDCGTQELVCAISQEPSPSMLQFCFSTGSSNSELWLPWRSGNAARVVEDWRNRLQNDIVFYVKWSILRFPNKIWLLSDFKMEINDLIVRRGIKLWVSFGNLLLSCLLIPASQSYFSHFSALYVWKQKLAPLLPFANNNNSCKITPLCIWC